MALLLALGFAWFVRRQRSLSTRAHLMEEAIRNHDFTFRLPTNGLPPGERAMQQTLNQLGETIRQQINRNEVESWERLTRVLTHEIMNATAPIMSISQSLLIHADVKGSAIEEGIQAIHDTSRHLGEFVACYRKLSELEKPVIEEIELRPLLDDMARAYPELAWEVSVSSDTVVRADARMLRQVLMNLTKNAVEAEARKMVVELVDNSPALASSKGKTHRQKNTPPEAWGRKTLYVGNDGLPIAAENRPSLFVPFFTTKRSGSGIGLSLSRRMMIQQGGMLDLAEKQCVGCSAGFLISFSVL